jgi:hypothetical protein
VEALGGHSYQNITNAHTCKMVLDLADFQQTRMIIFDNLPHNFGRHAVADVLRLVRKRGLQVVCILLMNADILSSNR